MSNKILVIDDNDEVRDMLHDLLMLKGYQVDTAATGTDALENLKSINPDLIICDIAMPDIDGFQVLEAVRAMPEFAKLPFLFLTASMVRSQEEKIISTSANGYLMKPYESSQLFQRLRDLLSQDEKE